jgi:AraC-like DNA-binding protein
VPPPAAPHRLEQLRQYLDHAYAEPLTLDALAQRARLSCTSLCRAFKAYTGKRLFDYLIERRIQAAMIALRGTDEKVVTIALNSGFRDLAYFNRKFKQLVGVTPTAYREVQSSTDHTRVCFR